MPWHARLSLDYTLEAGRTAARFQHDGPLRILQSLYPEGDAICHNVLVHPPSGLVGGDTLDVQVAVQAGAHGLVTTPGATRFYRSDGELALQRSRLRVHDGARLEWLPLETLCYSGCIAQNHLTLDLAPGAECMGWDLTALGLPHADLPFERGSFAVGLEHALRPTAGATAPHPRVRMPRTAWRMRHLVLDQREAHVVVAMVAEADAVGSPKTRDQTGLGQQLLGELQRAQLAVGLGMRAQIYIWPWAVHRPAGLAQALVEHVAALLVGGGNVLHALLVAFQRGDGRHLHGVKLP
jgi:hypothetical protein